MLTQGVGVEMGIPLYINMNRRLGGGSLRRRLTVSPPIMGGSQIGLSASKSEAPPIFVGGMGYYF